MKKQNLLKSFLSQALPARVGNCAFIIKVPFVSRLFWAAYGYLRPKDEAMVTVQDFGFRLYLDSRDTAPACTLLMLGRYEPFAAQVFSSLLQEGMTVVDIGAMIGYYTVLSAARVGHPAKCLRSNRSPRTSSYFAKTCRQMV